MKRMNDNKNNNDGSGKVVRPSFGLVSGTTGEPVKSEETEPRPKFHRYEIFGMDGKSLGVHTGLLGLSPGWVAISDDEGYISGMVAAGQWSSIRNLDYVDPTAVTEE